MSEPATSKASYFKIVLGVTAVVFLIGLVWGCPTRVAQGSELGQPGAVNPNPFAEAAGRISQRFPKARVTSIEDGGKISLDSRESVLGALTKGQVFLSANSDGVPSRVQLSAGQETAYREYVDSLLAEGDRLFKIGWEIDGRTFTNTALASATTAKVEPILSTSYFRIDSTLPNVVVDASPHPRVLLASFDSQGGAKPPAKTASDSFSVFNIFQRRVAWGKLDIIPLGTSFSPSPTSGSAILWTVAPGEPQKAVWKKGKSSCLDAVVKMTWSSFIPSIKLSISTNVDFGLSQGLKLQTGDVVLSAQRCR